MYGKAYISYETKFLIQNTIPFIKAQKNFGLFPESREVPAFVWNMDINFVVIVTWHYNIYDAWRLNTKINK